MEQEDEIIKKLKVKNDLTRKDREKEADLVAENILKKTGRDGKL